MQANRSKSTQINLRDSVTHNTDRDGLRSHGIGPKLSEGYFHHLIRKDGEKIKSNAELAAIFTVVSGLWGINMYAAGDDISKLLWTVTVGFGLAAGYKVYRIIKAIKTRKRHMEELNAFKAAGALQSTPN